MYRVNLLTFQTDMDGFRNTAFIIHLEVRDTIFVPHVGTYLFNYMKLPSRRPYCLDLTESEYGKGMRVLHTERMWYCLATACGVVTGILKKK